MLCCFLGSVELRESGIALHSDQQEEKKCFADLCDLMLVRSTCKPLKALGLNHSLGWQLLCSLPPNQPNAASNPKS